MQHNQGHFSTFRTSFCSDICSDCLLVKLCNGLEYNQTLFSSFETIRQTHLKVLVYSLTYIWIEYTIQHFSPPSKQLATLVYTAFVYSISCIEARNCTVTVCISRARHPLGREDMLRPHSVCGRRPACGI